MTTKEKIGAFVIGAGAGAIVGLLIWQYARRQLATGLEQGAGELARQVGMGEEEMRRRLEEGRAQLRSQIATQVPPIVRSTLDRQLASYGITPETGRRVAAVLAAADRVGLI